MNKDLTTKAFREIEKKNCEKQYCHRTQLCLSVSEHEDMGHNGLLTKPKKPLVRMNARSEAIARRSGRKPPPGRKQRLPQQEMEVLESSYDRYENHRRPATTTACWSGAFAGYVHQLHIGHSSLIESYFQQGIAGNKVDNEGTFLLKYLLSHFDKIGVPQMNISI